MLKTVINIINLKEKNNTYSPNIKWESRCIHIIVFTIVNVC